MKRAIYMLASLPLGILFIAGCGHPTADGTDQTVPANAQVVHVTASNFKFDLDKTSFKKGVPIDFEITTKEGAHGFSIVGTKIDASLDPSKPARIIWTPDQTGSFTIQCSEFCGSGHSDMKTTFQVS